MATPKPFPQAGFLSYLLAMNHTASRADASLSRELADILCDGDGQPGKAVGQLLQLLQARKAVLQSTFDSEQVADDLRRYQKFVKAGRPSPHIVQLRQQQGTVRHASSRSRQQFIAAAAGFVREAGIEIPQRVALEAFITHWIDINVPADFVALPQAPVALKRVGP